MPLTPLHVYAVSTSVVYIKIIVLRSAIAELFYFHTVQHGNYKEAVLAGMLCSNYLHIYSDDCKSTCLYAAFVLNVYKCKQFEMSLLCFECLCPFYLCFFFFFYTDDLALNYTKVACVLKKSISIRHTAVCTPGQLPQLHCKSLDCFYICSM